MKAVIGEHLWQIGVSENEPETVLVSVRPEISSGFTRRGLRYSECSDLCRHELFWADYPDYVSKVSSLTARLDQILGETDSRFAETSFPVFDRIGHILKINHDQSLYYAHLISELVNRGVDTIVCADDGDITLDEYGLFTSGRSIMPEIVRAFGSDAPMLELTQPPSRAGPESTSRFSFGQPIKTAKKIGAETLYNTFNELQFLLQTGMRSLPASLTVLSVGCKEVDALDDTRFRKVRLLKYHPDMEYVNRTGNWRHHAEFCDHVAADGEINRLLGHRGANLVRLVLPSISFFAERLELILEKRDKINSFLDRRQVDFVVFHTMAPFYLPNIIVREWCRTNDVPFACWMHGGYGAYESLQGYDVTDYRLSPRHLVYGQVISNLPKNPDWIMHKLGYSRSLAEICVAGSPFFENLYSGYGRPANDRKKILFCLGNYYHHNQFYFGHNRPESEISIWNAHKRILEVLVKYQDNFDITVKDYPDSPQKDMWLEILDDIGGKITYVSNERPFADVLIEADLHVFSWVSTTMFQSLYTDVDICLYDNTDLTEEARTLFEQDIVFGSGLDQFCSRFDGYLGRGDFYTQDKNRIRDLFIDPQNRARRPEQFEEYVATRVKGR